MFRCPGQDQRFWKPEDIFDVDCPECGKTIEFWKDEPKLKCPQCKSVVANPRLDLGCAKWCQYANQCLGVKTESKDSDMCSRLIGEMRRILALAPDQIGHTLRTLSYADAILAAEGGEPLVVKAAVILHHLGVGDVGYTEDACDTESTKRAAEVLAKHAVSEQIIETVRSIITAHHGGKQIDSQEFRIFSDAHKLADIQTAGLEHGRNIDLKDIAGSLDTQKGREIAEGLIAELRNTGKSQH
jgi:hypothetical protein